MANSPIAKSISPTVTTSSDAFVDYRKAYGVLHDMLSDCIEGGRLTEADIPDDYQAIVGQLCGPCMKAEFQMQRQDSEETPVAQQPTINQELLEACIQARAALPDAWHAVQCDTPKEVIGLLDRAIARAEAGNQVEPIASSQAATLLKDLVEMLSEVEDIEHDQFGCKEECALCAAKNYITKIEEGQPSPINLAIVLDGGLIQAVVTDAPEAFKGINTMIIDYDVDSPDKNDEMLGIVPQGGGKLVRAYSHATSIENAGIDLSRVADFVSDNAYGTGQERFAICDENPCEGCKDCNSDGERCVNENKCLAWQYYNNN